MKFLSDILAKAGLTVDGVVTLNNTATGQTPAANDNSTKLATTAWVRTFVQPYSLPIASASVLGGIKVGTGLSIDAITGVLSAVAGGSASIKSTQTFTATAGQTVFTITGGYTVGLIDVFLNGVYLSPNQTTATNGTTVTLGEAAAAGDIIDVIIASPVYQGATTTTDQLPEGVVNLYYTNARARAAISLTVTGTSGASTYDSATGVLNVPTYTLAGLGGVPTGRTITIDGVSYDLSANRTWNILPTGGATGDILAKSSATNYDVAWIPNYTSQVQHQVKLGATMTAGTAVYVSSSTGNAGTNMIVSKASNAAEGTSSKTLGLIATGGVTNDTVFVVTEGLLAGLDTSTASAGDPVWLGVNGGLIFGLLNKPTAPAHLVFIGVVTRAQQNNGEIFVKVQNGFELDELHNVSAQSPSDGDMIKYVASTGLWTKIAASTTNIVEGTNLYYTQSRFNTAFSGKSTTDLAEGTNLYYTQSRFDTAFAAKSTSNLTEGTNLYYTQARFDTAFAAKSTTNLTEGTNLYYTTARVNTDFDTRLATKSTTNLAEGTNLYYTDARVGSYLSTNSYATQSYVSTQINNLISGAPGLLDTLDELAAALGDDPNFATTVSTALSNRLRIDIGTQGLTSTQQGYGRTNLGLGSLATLSSIGNSYITDLAWSKLTGTPTSISGYGITDSLVYTTSTYSNPSWITALAWSKITGAPAFITSYTETDTLATVTGRGATTSTAVTFSGGASISNLLINGAPSISESSLALGAMGTTEGGQLTLNKATSYTYAAHLDIWQDVFRILYGTNTVTSGVALSVNLSTRQLILPSYTATSSFTGTAAGVLAFDSSGNILTIAVPGGAVSSVNAGTGVSVNQNTGAVTVSIGQSVATSASPTFDQVIATNNGNGTNFKIGDDAWIGDINAANTFRVQGQQDATQGYIVFGNSNTTALGRSGTGALTYGGNTVYHAGNLTNLNQLTNGPGYITSYTETSTLAQVTARGASTSTTLNLDGRVNIGNGLTRPSALNSDSVAHARIGGADVHLFIASLGAAGGYKVAVQSARTSDFASFGLDLQSNGGTLYYGGNEVATRTWVTSQSYLTSITSSQVTTALGFTPYNSTNPSGYITSAALTQLVSPNGATVVAADSAMPSAGHSFIHTLGLGPNGNDGHILGMTWASTTTVYGAQIWVDTDPNNRMAFRSRSSAGVWTGWNEVIHSSNYTSYSPSLTGTGASGTWGISITGSAATLDGYSRNQTGGANTIVQRDSNGYIQNSYFYSSGGGTERNGSGLGYIAGFNSSDYYIRSYNSTAVASFLGLGSAAYQNTGAFALVNGSTSNSFGVLEINYASTNFNPSAGPRTTISSMSVKMWNNYFNGTGLGSDYGTVMQYYSLSGHVESQVYFDAAGGNWYRTASYNSAYGSWQQYITSANIGAQSVSYASTAGSATSASNSSTTSQRSFDYLYASSYLESGGAVYGTIFYDNNDRGYYLDPNTSGTSLRIAGSIFSDGSFGTNGYGTGGNSTAGRVFAPKGGAYSYSGGGITGAIKIRLPFRSNDLMWSMKVRIYSYSVNQTSEYLLGNYSYSQGAYNYSATYLGGDSSTRCNVRFGNEGGYDCIWIGETSTSWSYPVVSVMDFMGGYSNGSVGNYLSNWDISIVTSFGTVGATVAPNIKFGNAYSYSYRGTDNIDGTGAASYHPSGIYSTGTNWLYGTMYLNGNSINDVSSVTASIYYDRNDTTYFFDGDGQTRAYRMNLSSGQVQAANNAGGRLRISSWTNGESVINGNCHNIVLGPASTRTGAGLFYAGIAINGLMNYGGVTTYDVAPHIWLGGYYRDTPGSERSDFVVAIKSGTGTSGAGSDLPEVRFRVDYNGVVTSYGDMRSPIFYDSNNTSYYGDFDSTSRMYQINVNYIHSQYTSLTAPRWDTSFYVLQSQHWYAHSSTQDMYLGESNRVRIGGPISRGSHSSGFLEGSYNNIGGNDGKSNPIYTIGSSYNPSDTSLGNMYGIGYSHPNFWGSGKVAGWGLYVANNGTIDACIGGDSTSSVGIWSRLDIVAYSDARVKDNVIVIDNAVQKVQSIRGVTFTRNDIDDKNKRHCGVIAQEVLAVMPELVTGDEESKYSVAYGNMAGLFIEAIKEQQSQIESQKSEIEELKDLVKQLINR
jgi:hypothetical protein